MWLVAAPRSGHHRPCYYRAGSAGALVLSAVSVPAPRGTVWPRGTVQAAKLLINPAVVCVAPYSLCSGLSAAPTPSS